MGIGLVHVDNFIKGVIWREGLSLVVFSRFPFLLSLLPPFGQPSNLLDIFGGDHFSVLLYNIVVGDLLLSTL